MRKGEQDAVVITGGSAHWRDRVGGLTLAGISLKCLRANTLQWVGLLPWHCPVPQERHCGNLSVLDCCQRDRGIHPY